MKKLAIISDIICLIGILSMLIIRIHDSEMWYKAIMAIIALIVLIRLIYKAKKSKNNQFTYINCVRFVYLQTVKDVLRMKEYYEKVKRIQNENYQQYYSVWFYIVDDGYETNFRC